METRGNETFLYYKKKQNHCYTKSVAFGAHRSIYTVFPVFCLIPFYNVTVTLWLYSFTLVLLLRGGSNQDHCFLLVNHYSSNLPTAFTHENPVDLRRFNTRPSAVGPAPRAAGSQRGEGSPAIPRRLLVRCVIS